MTVKNLLLVFLLIEAIAIIRSENDQPNESNNNNPLIDLTSLYNYRNIDKNSDQSKVSNHIRLKRQFGYDQRRPLPIVIGGLGVGIGGPRFGFGRPSFGGQGFGYGRSGFAGRGFGGRGFGGFGGRGFGGFSGRGFGGRGFGGFGGRGFGSFGGRGFGGFGGRGFGGFGGRGFGGFGGRGGRG